MDHRIRKLMTMFKVLLCKDDIERFHLSGKEGGRELVYGEDCVDAAIQGLEGYWKKRKTG